MNMPLPRNELIREAFAHVLRETGLVVERFADKYKLNGATLRAWRDGKAERSMSYTRQCELIRAIEKEGIVFAPGARGFWFRPNENGVQSVKIEPLSQRTNSQGHNSETVAAAGMCDDYPAVHP